MPDRATVLRLKEVGVGAGFRLKGSQKYPDDYAAHLMNEPCYLSANNRQFVEALTGGQVRAKGDWQIRFKAGTDVDEKDIAIIITLSNRKFNLIGSSAGSNEVARVMEANEIK